MRFLHRYAFWIFLFCLVTALVSAPSPDSARTRIADGFDHPVGKPDAEGYYMSRGFGRDFTWARTGTGSKGEIKIRAGPFMLLRTALSFWLATCAWDGQLGDYSPHFSRRPREEDGRFRVRSPGRILVREGQQIVRGQHIGTIGSNRGMYTAHLHFEIRKNLLSVTISAPSGRTTRTITCPVPSSPNA